MVGLVAVTSLADSAGQAPPALTARAGTPAAGTPDSAAAPAAVPASSETPASPTPAPFVEATQLQQDLPTPPIRALAGVAAPPSVMPKAVEPSEECAAALAAVESTGLELPDNTAFRCPGRTEQAEGDRQHSGVACWGNATFCPGGSYIAVNPDQIGQGAHRLRYVVAHEICHVQAYLQGALGGTEAEADDCAARAGFPRP